MLSLFVCRMLLLFNAQQDCGIDASGTCVPSTTTAPTIVAPTAAVSPTVNQRLLVMIMNYSLCGLSPTLTPDAARSIFLGPNGDGSGGLAQKYTQCSYGAFNLNASAFRAQVITPTSCSTSITASCSWWSISNGADTIAKTIPGLNFSDFTHYAYVVPPNMSSVCMWAGLALLPGNQIWLQTSSYGVSRWATIFQEAIHNYGESLPLVGVIRHGSCYVTLYKPLCLRIWL